MGTDENKFKRVDWDHDGPLASDDDEVEAARRAATHAAAEIGKRQ